MWPLRTTEATSLHHSSHWTTITRCYANRPTDRSKSDEAKSKPKNHPNDRPTNNRMTRWAFDKRKDRSVFQFPLFPRLLLYKRIFTTLRWARTTRRGNSEKPRHHWAVFVVSLAALVVPVDIWQVLYLVLQIMYNQSHVPRPLTTRLGRVLWGKLRKSIKPANIAVQYWRDCFERTTERAHGTVGKYILSKPGGYYYIY